jgi:hypothetical protein
MDRQQPARFCARQAALAVVCALLMLFVGFAQTNHVHTSSSANHECSVCSVAHAGALISATYQPVPVFTRSILASCPEASPHSLLHNFVLSIRPPPSA